MGLFLAILLAVAAKENRAATSVSKFYDSNMLPEDSDYQYRILEMSLSMSMMFPSTKVVPTIAPSSLSASNDSPEFVRPSRNVNSPIPSMVSTPKEPVIPNIPSSVPSPTPMIPYSTSSVPNQTPTVTNSPTYIGSPSISSLPPFTLSPATSTIAPSLNDPSLPPITSLPLPSDPNVAPSDSAATPNAATPSQASGSSPTFAPVFVLTILPTSVGNPTTSIVSTNAPAIVPTGQAPNSVPTSSKPVTAPPVTAAPVSILVPPPLPAANKNPTIARGGSSSNLPAEVPIQSFFGAGAIVAVALVASLALLGVAYFYWRRRRVAAL